MRIFALRLFLRLPYHPDQQGYPGAVDVIDVAEIEHLSIPGTVDWNRGTATPGLDLKDTLTINQDGTYVWNSSWDGKVITGKWDEIIGDTDSPIVLRKGESGDEWNLSKSKSGISLYDPKSGYMNYTVNL